MKWNLLAISGSTAGSVVDIASLLGPRAMNDKTICYYRRHRVFTGPFTTTAPPV